MALKERQKRQWKRFEETMGMGRDRRRECARLCRELWPEECQRIMETAEKVLDHTFLFQLPWDMEQTREPVRFPEKIDWSYVLNEDPEFAYQMNRHRYWICLGQAYGLTGEEAYVRELAFQLKDWTEKEPWSEKNENTGLTWRTLEAGLRADYWVRAMALCTDSPSVTEETKEYFLEGLKVHGQCLYENPRTGFSQKSNWGIMEYAGLYLLGFILEEEAYVEKARRYLKNGLRIQIMDDGMHWEMSSMYHNEVLMALLEVIRIGKIWGDEPFSREELARIEQMAEVTLKLRTPAGRQPVTGDSDDTDVRDLLSQAALILENGRLKAGGFEQLDYESIWLFGPWGAEDYRRLKAEEEGEPGLIWLPCSGQAVMRSSQRADACWLYFVNGPLGGGHGHQDKLHIGLWLKGEEVLADSGRYTYRDIPLRYRLKAARAHNVPMVRGKEYAKSKDTWTYETLIRPFPNGGCKKGEYLFLEGSHGGYLEEGIVVQRRIVAVDFDILAVSDTFSGRLPKEIEQHFYFGETIRLTRTEEGVEGAGQSCRFVIRSFAEGGAAFLDLRTGPVSRHYNQLGERERLVVRGKGVRTLTTFFVVRHSETNFHDQSCQTRERAKEKPGEDPLVIPEPVCSGVSGEPVGIQSGEGYVVMAGNRKTGLVFMQQEAGNGTDYNGIRGMYGLGRTMVCDLKEEPPGCMTVLQW